MKKLTYIIVLTVALVAGQALAVQVTQVALSYENGATVARVTADGPFQFRHQTEVPKEGKGDRMILDLVGATTGLSAKSYTNLPPCGITGIRSGQYSVTPEKVVRVVFDLTKPPVYQVQQQGNSIKVIFTDKAVSAFTTWTTDAAVKPAQPTTVVAKPTPAVAQSPVTSAPKEASAIDMAKKTEQDRLASLSSNTKPSTSQQASPATAAPTPQATKPVVVASQPVAAPVAVKNPAVESPKPVTQTAPAVAPTTTVVANPIQNEQKPVPTPVVAANPAQSTSTAPVTPTMVAKPIQNDLKPVPTTIVSAKPVPSEPNTIPPATVVAKATPVESKPTPTTIVVAKPVQESPKTVATPTVAAHAPAQADVKTTVPATVSPKPSTTIADASTKPAAQSAPVTPLAKPVPVATTGNQIQQALSAKPANPPTADNKPVVAVKVDEKTDIKPENKPLTAVPVTPIPTAPQAKAPVTTETKPVTEIAKTDVNTPAVANQVPAKPSDTNAKPATTIPKPLTDDGKGQLAEADDATSANPDLPGTKATSRFRRSAAADAKIKGTMVAEFPQRLVVKYESLGNRDPFATLIDDSRTFNTPIQNRVPNIDGLRLVGIIESDRGATDNRALFEDKNGYSYILSSGDKVQRGYVLRVENDRVYFQIFEYGWSRTVALAIENAN